MLAQWLFVCPQNHVGLQSKSLYVQSCGDSLFLYCSYTDSVVLCCQYLQTVQNALLSTQNTSQSWADLWAMNDFVWKNSFTLVTSKTLYTIPKGSKCKKAEERHVGQEPRVGLPNPATSNLSLLCCSTPILLHIKTQLHAFCVATVSKWQKSYT